MRLLYSNKEKDLGIKSASFNEWSIWHFFAHFSCFSSLLFYQLTHSAIVRSLLIHDAILGHFLSVRFIMKHPQSSCWLISSYQGRWLLEVYAPDVSHSCTMGNLLPRFTVYWGLLLIWIWSYCSFVSWIILSAFRSLPSPPLPPPIFPFTPANKMFFLYGGTVLSLFLCKRYTHFFVYRMGSWGYTEVS